MYQYKIKIGDYKESPKEMYKIIEYKNNCISKTKKIGMSIKSEYSKLPNNTNVTFGVYDDCTHEGEMVNILTWKEIINICGLH